MSISLYDHPSSGGYFLQDDASNTATASHPKGEALGRGETGDLHHECAADKTAAIV